MTTPELPAIALVAASLSFPALAAPHDALLPMEARFSRQAHNCSQFIGGPAFGDSVSADYSRQLAAALAGGKGDDNAALQRIQSACTARLGGNLKRVFYAGPYRASREDPLMSLGAGLND